MIIYCYSLTNYLFHGIYVIVASVYLKIENVTLGSGVTDIHDQRLDRCFGVSVVMWNIGSLS